MAKVNKMGMSDKALLESRNIRFSASREASAKRVKSEMDNDGSNQIIDDMLSGKISKEDAADWFRNKFSK